MNDLFMKILLRISREDVEQCDAAPMVGKLQKFLKDAETARKFAGKIEMAVDGYDDDPRELHQIKEVREFLTKLDKEFPYLFWFLSTDGGFLQVLWFCTCPGKPRGLLGADFDDAVVKEFMDRHYSAMEELGERFHFSSEEIKQRQSEVERSFNSRFVVSSFVGTAVPEIIEGLNPFNREYVRRRSRDEFNVETKAKNKIMQLMKLIKDKLKLRNRK